MVGAVGVAGRPVDDPALWRAEPAWRAIDFISDLHLCPGLPLTTAAWADYLQGAAADAVVILGDLFEVWVGDDARTLPFESGLVATLAKASSRRPLFFMVGNRDFLAGRELMQATGVNALPDPTCLEAFGQRIVLSHGDALCLSDQPYQAFRRTVRSARWQHDFLARPLGERLSIAADIRRRSADRRRFDGEPDADIDPAAATALLSHWDAATLIHGHTHRAGSQMFAPGVTRHVLSDWDLDDAQAPRAEVLRFSEGGIARLDPRSATTH